jgi:hypothetical protein
MPYIAARRLEMGVDDAGEPIYREIGEAVPEVADWDNPTPYIEAGHVVWVPETAAGADEGPQGRAHADAKMRALAATEQERDPSLSDEEALRRAAVSDAGVLVHQSWARPASVGELGAPESHRAAPAAESKPEPRKRSRRPRKKKL